MGVLKADDHGSVEGSPGALDLLQACAEVGRPVVMVSNNAEAAIDVFLQRHQLRHLVQAVMCRHRPQWGCRPNSNGVPHADPLRRRPRLGEHSQSAGEVATRRGPEIESITKGHSAISDLEKSSQRSLNSVDFPLPLGPTSAVTERGGRTSDTSLITSPSSYPTQSDNTWTPLTKVRLT